MITNKQLLAVVLFVLPSIVSAQENMNLDVFTLSGSNMVLLQKDKLKHSEDGFRLFFTDMLYQDSLIVKIDSIEHVPCGGPNSVFFINDSVGFLFESGGCYAYYNWMYRTPDKGITWKKVVFETNTELFPTLNADNFFMFNHERGIIIWQVTNGNLIYSTTVDGGFTWKRETQPLGFDISIRNINHIHFAKNGQITILISEYSREKTEQNEALIFQSNDFGKTWRQLK